MKLILVAEIFFKTVKLGYKVDNWLFEIFVKVRKS